MCVCMIENFEIAFKRRRGKYVFFPQTNQHIVNIWENWTVATGNGHTFLTGMAISLGLRQRKTRQIPRKLNISMQSMCGKFDLYGFQYFLVIIQQYRCKLYGRNISFEFMCKPCEWNKKNTDRILRPCVCLAEIVAWFTALLWMVNHGYLFRLTNSNWTSFCVWYQNIYHLGSL